MIELMVVITISAILLALAGPSMSRLIANQRLRSTATDLHIALMKTRTEAIKRNTSVRLTATDGSWNAGWTIINPAAPLGAPLEFHGPLASVTVTSSVTEVVYRETGRTSNAGAVSFVFAGSGTDQTRCLSITPAGRPYLKEGSAC
jgi:type IV fimbrial biogenesis protein FimT